MSCNKKAHGPKGNNKHTQSIRNREAAMKNGTHPKARRIARNSALHTAKVAAYGLSASTLRKLEKAGYAQPIDSPAAAEAARRYLRPAPVDLEDAA